MGDLGGRTQAERSNRTRLLICEATLDALVEIDSHRVSASHVAARANISRGAITHHYPTRNDMFVAAFEHLVEQWQSAYPFNTGPDYTRRSIDEFVDDLWAAIYEPRWFAAAMALMLASAKDTELGSRLEATMKSWLIERDLAALKILGINSKESTTFALYELILSALRGIVFYSSFSDNRSEAERQVKLLRDMAKRTLEANQPFDYLRL